ncbi:MAG: hypothetical protein AB7F85_09400 [Hyphomonadaceae bacterium]
MPDAGKPHHISPTGPRQRPWDTGVSVPLPDGVGFTDAERWAWAQIIRGDIADMRFSTGQDDGAGSDANEEIDGPDGVKVLKPWPASRKLSARFFDTILFQEPWASAKVRPWVRVYCAWIDERERLNWAHAQAPDELALLCSRIDAQPIWQGTRFAGSVSLSGARLQQGLLGDRLQVGGSLQCREGFTSGADIRLLGAHICGNLGMDGAQLTSALAADGIRIDGGLFCRDGFRARGEVRLLHARIQGSAEFAKCELNGLSGDGMIVGGNLGMDGAQLTSALAADGIRIDGGLFCRDGFRARGEVRLLHARIQGSAEFAKCELNGLSGDGMIVGGNLFMQDNFKSTGPVRLPSARVGAVMTIIGAELEKGLTADGLHIEGSLLCRGGARVEDEVNLLGARINNNAQLRGNFNGLVDLTGSEIAGELQFDQGGELPAVWGENARLVLRNVTCGALAGVISSFRRANHRGKRVLSVPVDMLGLAYNRIGGSQGYYGEAGKTLADAPVKELVALLQSDAPKKRVFTPQPYHQLADALATAGREEKAQRVRFALLEHERAAKGVPTPRKFALLLSRHLIGHGFENWRAALGFAALVLGTAAVGLAFEGRPMVTSLAAMDWRAMGDWGGYALGNAIPILELDPSHETFVKDRFGDAEPIWLKSILYSSKLLGFALLSYLAAGLTGFASRSARR